MLARSAGALVALVAACPLTLPAHADQNAIPDRDMRLFPEWFPGVYDNMEPVYFGARLDVPEEERQERLHHIFTPIESALRVSPGLRPGPRSASRGRG